MNEDIVTRLRKQMQGCDNRNCEGCEVENEAIDEIERLRMTLQLMQIDYRTQIAGLKMRCQCGAGRD